LSTKKNAKKGGMAVERHIERNRQAKMQGRQAAARVARRVAAAGTLAERRRRRVN